MLSDNNYKLVSIHTPTQGVTCPDHKIKIIIECFNPHTHAGCDATPEKSAKVEIVSIHTPTQGVTICINSG